MTYQIYVIFINEILSRNKMCQCFVKTWVLTNAAICLQITLLGKKEGSDDSKNSTWEPPSISGGQWCPGGTRQVQSYKF